MARERKWGMFTETGKLIDIYNDASGEVESLLDEVQSWKDGMEGTGLESTSKYEALEDAEQYLETANDTLGQGVDNIPRELQEKEVSYPVWRKRRMPRHLRLSNAVCKLHAVVDCLAHAADVGFCLDEDDTGLVEDWVEDLNNAVDELEAVEFPGMYG